ncbi:hypothetical protein BDP55DRAFT_546936, partial [Colletotrichum godetiae]
GDSAQITKTTIETIEYHQRNIPWNQPNSTFQDAITVCRRLNIPYLWMDSLCIIHNSAADWKDQASQMGYLTIVATKSSDASGGCFVNTGDEYMSKLLPECKDTYVPYQEMRLSPRVLHSCAQEVIWVCRNKDPKYLWYRTVREHSRLRLSKQEDKMAALAGLAEQIQNLQLSNQYLVGLLEKTLLHDLLWHLNNCYKAPK